MKSEIIQEFDGVINGIHFDDRYVYFSVEYVADHFIEKFCVDVPEAFIRDLKYTIERNRDKTENFSFAEIEQDFYFMINQADLIEELEPPLYWGYHDELLAGFKGGYEFTPLLQPIDMER